MAAATADADARLRVVTLVTLPTKIAMNLQTIGTVMRL
jgi:hypothetical protein